MIEIILNIYMKFVISTNIVIWYKWTSFMNHVKSLIIIISQMGFCQGINMW
jgi:hypothetical protein